MADATDRKSILELKRNRAFTKAVSNMAITPGEGSPVYINVYAAKSDGTAYTKENYAYYYNGVMI